MKLEERPEIGIRNREQFIKRVESLIKPMKVSYFLFFQSLRKVLPLPILKRLLYRASRRTPRIGFVIEPYSVFLFFRLKDLDYAQSLLPERYELAKTKIFADEEPDYYFGSGNLCTRASTFWGARQESYLIARDKKTGLLSWIFIGILSNTVISEPATGVSDPNSNNAVFTTTPQGEVILDFAEDRTGRRLALTGKINGGTLRRTDEPIWLMGNTSIAHCKAMADGDNEPFAVVFDPAEVEYALDVPPEDIKVTENTLFPGLAEPELCKVLCFPYAQHYIADSPGCHTVVKDRADMIRRYNDIAQGGEMRTFTAKTIVLNILWSFLVGAAITIGLVLIL